MRLIESRNIIVVIVMSQLKWLFYWFSFPRKNMGTRIFFCYDWVSEPRHL